MSTESESFFMDNIQQVRNFNFIFYGKKLKPGKNQEFLIDPQSHLSINEISQLNHFYQKELERKLVESFSPILFQPNVENVVMQAYMDKQENTLSLKDSREINIHYGASYEEIHYTADYEDLIQSEEDILMNAFSKFIANFSERDSFQVIILCYVADHNKFMVSEIKEKNLDDGYIRQIAENSVYKSNFEKLITTFLSKKKFGAWLNNDKGEIRFYPKSQTLIWDHYKAEKESKSLHKILKTSF